jgi:cytochrome c-type biogenesis protein CcmH/NrfF
MFRAKSLLTYIQCGLVLAAIFVFLGAGDQNVRFDRLGHQMMCACGDCEYALLECNHVGCPLSEGMRKDLASYIQRGDSDNVILQAFIQKFGPTVLAAPTTTGFNRVAWIIPYLVLVLGLGSVYLIVRSWRKRPAPSIADGIPHVQGAALNQYSDQVRRETDL